MGMLIHHGATWDAHPPWCPLVGKIWNIDEDACSTQIYTQRYMQHNKVYSLLSCINLSDFVTENRLKLNESGFFGQAAQIYVASSFFLNQVV